MKTRGARLLCCAAILQCALSCTRKRPARESTEPPAKGRLTTLPSAPAGFVAPRDISEAEGKHSIVVARSAGNAFEAWLIDAAERTYPPRQDVLRVFSARAPKNRPNMDAGKDQLWWHSDFDGVKMPYAITTGTIHYYIDFLRGYRKGATHTEYVVPDKASSKLEYSASVTFAKKLERNGRSFHDVYMVEMLLKVEVHYGTNAGAFGFYKDRAVVLNKNGQVLAIFGDGDFKEPRHNSFQWAA